LLRVSAHSVVKIHAAVTAQPEPSGSLMRRCVPPVLAWCFTQFDDVLPAGLTMILPTM
jgi:hypothetical protein